MPNGFHPRKQGDIGEAHAIAWLTEMGADVSVPLFHSPDYDVIAQFSEELLRVQVKTSRVRDGDRFTVHIATNGGNRSWNGAVKYFDRRRCDFLFARLVDGRRWFIPSSAVSGSTSIVLGGPKYAEYQIDENGAIPDAARARLECAELRGSSGDGESGRSVKSVAQPQWVRIPPPPLSVRENGQSISRSSNDRVGRCRMSSGHQMTVPIGPFRAAELAPGDQFEVIADGPGEVSCVTGPRRACPAGADPTDPHHSRSCCACGRRFSFRREFDSIWRTRSRVMPKSRPICSRVMGSRSVSP